ncbi:hypothetical protein KPH14_005379 [Odynerus spinipes]|uniref:Uncharacterized protein n=1 Tax=Odynerus spinipes TaxID=1348599 RepID=A0AAD9VJB8_9HYME|nr:hypothetical protein KPH14_005379 [Odynerus spinipes]
MIGLSREMSKKLLSHDLRGIYDRLDTRLFDNLEHRNLYVVDFDCDGAINILHEANSSRMFIAPTKWLLLQDARSSNDINYITSSQFIKKSFENLAVYPDSEVILARRLQDDFLELLSIYRPSPHRGVILEDRGNWSLTRGIVMRDHHAASRRRRDLQLTPLKSCLVMTDPDTINHLTDYHDKHIDPVTKAGYPWVLHLVHRMNATVTFNITNTWGYRDENGSWSGMTGMLQRREIDFGGTGTFFVKERIGIVKYIQLYTHTGSRFVFRQPLLSTVSNIFVLPFHRSVWMAISVLIVLVIVLLFISMRWEYHCGASAKSASYWQQMNPGKPTFGDNLLVILGAFAQQGYSYEPYRVPSRIVTLMLLIAALSLYASYTANIVALLQSTTDSIQTVADLYNSPLKLGAQDVIYNRYYFKSFQDPIRRAVIDEKIEPKGKKSSWMSMEKGVKKLREELFAFHGEVGTIYKIMQDTFQEEEKCGITAIDFLNVLYPLLIIQTQSPYLEIIKNSALLLRESGLKFREEKRLYTSKPLCHGHMSFISIGFTECYFALLAMGYGVVLTLVVLAMEFLWHRMRRSDITDITENMEVIETDDQVLPS